MSKAIFFDVDGTVLSHRTKKIPQSFLRSMEKLQKNGHRCLLATGRSLQELYSLQVLPCPFDGYVTLNGQLCLDRNLEPVYQEPISGKALERLVEIFNAREFPLIMVEKDRLYINYVDEKVRQIQKEISSEVPDVGTYDGKDIYMATIFLDRDRENEVDLDGLHLARWHDRASDIVNEGSSKVKGIQAIMKVMNIDHEDTVAFGDERNDVEMLEYVKLAVAMGNGCPQAKQVADYVTDDIDEDGVEKALIHLGLID